MFACSTGANSNSHVLSEVAPVALFEVGVNGSDLRQTPLKPLTSTIGSDSSALSTDSDPSPPTRGLAMARAVRSGVFVNRGRVTNLRGMLRGSVEHCPATRFPHAESVVQPLIVSLLLASVLVATPLSAQSPPTASNSTSKPDAAADSLGSPSRPKTTKAKSARVGTAKVAT